MAKKTETRHGTSKTVAIATATRKLGEARARLEQLRRALDMYERQIERADDTRTVRDLADQIDVVRKAAYVASAMVDLEDACIGQ